MKFWKICIISFALGFAYELFTDTRQKPLETLEACERQARLNELKHIYSGFTFNESQRGLLKRYSAVYRRLPEPERMRVEAMAHVFMAEVKFVAVGYEEVTEEMRLLVAVEACVLVMNRGFEGYRRLTRVEFWDKPPRGKTETDWAGDCNGRRVRVLWPAIISPSYRLSQNLGFSYNIILHEFAHVLDMADDWEAQSIPVPQGTTEASRWNAMLASEYPRLQEAHRLAACRHANSAAKLCRLPAIRSYAVSNPKRTEFFPVATEVFISNTKELKAYSPALYHRLRRYYGFDPGTWQASRGGGFRNPSPEFPQYLCEQE